MLSGGNNYSSCNVSFRQFLEYAEHFEEEKTRKVAIATTKDFKKIVIIIYSLFVKESPKFSNFLGVKDFLRLTSINEVKEIRKKSNLNSYKMKQLYQKEGKDVYVYEYE